MTPDEFSDLVMGFGPNVQAKPILETVRFTVGGRTFTTLGWPEAGWAVVKVAPSRKAWALSLGDGVAREPGRRRNGGIVLMHLAAIDAGVAVELLAEAWSLIHRADGPRARRGVDAAGRTLAA